MANLLPPIPQDEIKENFRWREWFRNLGNYIQVAQTGGSPWTILQGGTGANTLSSGALLKGAGTSAITIGILSVGISMVVDGFLLIILISGLFAVDFYMAISTLTLFGASGILLYLLQINNQ